MGDLRPVVPAGRKPDRWLPASIAAVAFLVLVAIAKPWGRGTTSLPAFPSATAAPAAAASVQPTRTSGRGRYNPALFGQDPPDPAWQLWPAGYVVDFGLAGPVTMGTDPSEAARSPHPADHPLALRPSPSPTLPPPFGSALPIRIGQADNLLVLGINTPADVDVVQFRLTRFDGTRAVVVPIVVLPTPWPVRYFHVIGVESPDSSDVLGAWQAGTYWLALYADGGALIRSVVVSIDAPSRAAASLTAAPAPH
jgi:hypothetical protein